jgi:DNA helicase-2/ATP-dependent DNA helicase PcrA
MTVTDGTGFLFEVDDAGVVDEAGEAAGAQGPVDLLVGLNEPQRAAVMHGDGPLCILAGPGSGKTRVITSRIAWLVRERGVRPEEIVAITFTNKAAREMRERVETLLPAGTMKRAWISTFHSMCARILRRDIELLGRGYTRDYTIYDTHDRNQLLKDLLKRANFDLTHYRPAIVGGWISDWKNRGYRDSPEDAFQEGDGIDHEVFDRIRRSYEEAMLANNALDFDDLLIRVVELFDEQHGARDAYARRFRYVLVDEYQDTNRVQYLLARHLASYHGNLAVCGDPDQSIYAWRGADIRNILAFEEDFTGPKLVRLEQNYRSAANILKAAQAVISLNCERKDKDLWTEREAGEPLTVIECGDENDEASEIAGRIHTLVAGGRSPSDIAIFYRANFMQRALESQLRLSQVPYQIVGGVEFYQRREIRDLIAYLKLIVNPKDDVAFQRVVNVPARGVGARSMELLTEWAQDRRLSALDAARSTEALALIRGRAKKSLAVFAQLMENLAPLADQTASYALETVLGETEFTTWLAQQNEEAGPDREGNVDELRTHAEEYDRLYPEGGLRGFLQDIALVSEVDDLEDEAGKVTLMTLHSAKGLEFPVVFIAGCEEELLPHARALEEGEQGLEEERRLFYVGLTRAEDVLFLTWAARRLHFGQETFRSASRFLEEIPPELVEGARAQEEDEEEVLGRYNPAEDVPTIRVGDRVEHDHFGVGTVTRLLGTGINARATVDFPRHGIKQLLLQYANLRVAGGGGA